MSRIKITQINKINTNKQNKIKLFRVMGMGYYGMVHICMHTLGHS